MIFVSNTTTPAIRPGRAPRFLLVALLVSTLAAGAQHAHGRADAASVSRVPPSVVANQEQLTGAYGERYPAVASFKGIPFAAPPVGELRWQAPQPQRPRTGKQNAQRYAAGCFQGSHTTDWYRRVSRSFGLKEAPIVDPPFSEDCLYLNIWTPSLKARTALPVMVWIHGGSNKGGWSFEPNYEGEALAARGRVVVVSIPYRLGVFGFFGHPELRSAAAASNFGLLDQIAALQWVQKNIRRFGGDPGNVTVFGESSGAADIGYLLTSPLAQGLFRRAISESGGYQMTANADLAEAQQVGLDLANALPSRPDLAALRRLSSAEIFRVANEALHTHDWRPAIDGRSLLMSPAASYGRNGVPVDLLIGSNENEYYMYVDGDPASLAQALQQFSPLVRDLLASRAAQEPDTHRGNDKATALVRMACPPYLMAAAAARGGHRSWVYRFSRVRRGPGGELMLAYHGAEIPYVFDTHDSWLTSDAADTDLTTAMLAYWSNFARTGDPNGAGLAPWPVFESANAHVQELGTRIGVIAAPDKALCDRLAAEVYPGWTP